MLLRDLLRLKDAINFGIGKQKLVTPGTLFPGNSPDGGQIGALQSKFHLVQPVRYRERAGDEV